MSFLKVYLYTHTHTHTKFNIYKRNTYK